MGISISAAGAPGLPASAETKQSQSAEDSGFEALLALAQINTSSDSGASGTAPDPAGSGTGGSYASDPAVQAFMKYMNESTAQKFEDAWLAAHGLTEADLKNMPPAKRELILKEMVQDMQREIEQKTQEKLEKAETLA